MGVPPVSGILREGGGGYFELAYWIMNITVFEMRTHSPRPFDKEGNVGRTGEAQLLVCVDPLDE